MEPVRAQRKSSPHIWKDSDGHGRAHTDLCIHTHPNTHVHTLADTHMHTHHIWNISSVLAGPVGGWGVFLFFPLLFPYSFYLLFVSCKPRDIGETGVGQWVLYQHCPAGGTSSLLHFICRGWCLWNVRISLASPQKLRQLPRSDARLKPKAKNRPRQTITYWWMWVLPKLKKKKKRKENNSKNVTSPAGSHNLRWQSVCLA